jgi:hypothetical protein
MKIIIAPFLTLAFLLMNVNACQETPEQFILQDMAAFDQAFIPVYFFVETNQMTLAKKSIFHLNQAWQKFRGRYGNLYPESVDYQEAIRMTDVWLSEAYLSIGEPNTIAAFLYLDNVKYQMIEWRSLHDLDYILDSIWDFENSIYLVEEVASDPMLCLLDYCEFEALVEELNLSWKYLNMTYLEMKDFGINDDAYFKILTRKDQLKNSLIEFNRAVETAEGYYVAEKAQQMKLAYLNYLAGFGDFLIYKTHYAAL